MKNEKPLFTFSHSSLSIMEQCPRKWFLRYICRYFFKLRQPWSDFGLLVHTVAENYKGGGKKEINNLIKHFMFYQDGPHQGEKKYHIGESYKERYQVSFKNLLSFYNTYLKGTKKILNEKEFRLALNDYINLLGKVDVLYQDKNGTWIVVDYKTSKRKSDQSKQLATYYLLMRMKSKKKPKKLKCYVVYLALESLEDNVEKFVDEYILDENDIESCENRIWSAMNRIINCQDRKEKWRKKPSKLCDYCEYHYYGLCSGNKVDDEEI